MLDSTPSLSPVIELSESTYAATGALKGGSGPAGIAVNRKTRKIYVVETGNGTEIGRAHV